MKLSAPTQGMFLIACTLAILALLGMFVAIPIVSSNVFWVMTIAFVMLALANLMKGV